MDFSYRSPLSCKSARSGKMGLRKPKKIALHVPSKTIGVFPQMHPVSGMYLAAAADGKRLVRS